MKRYKISNGRKTFIVDAKDSKQALYKVISKVNVADSVNIPSNVESELRRYGSRYGYDWEEIYDGVNSRVNRERMSLSEAVEDIKEDMASGKSLYDSSKSVKDSSRLADLAYKFAQEASYLDRANFAHSRKYLSADDDKKVNDLYRLGLQVLQQLKQEVEGMRRAGKPERESYGMSKIASLISDGANMLRWAGDNISNSLGYRCNELAKKILEALRDYRDLAVSSKRRDSSCTVKDGIAADVISEIKRQYPQVKISNVLYKKVSDFYMLQFVITGLPGIDRFNHTKDVSSERFIRYVLKKHGAKENYTNVSSYGNDTSVKAFFVDNVQ